MSESTSETRDFDAGDAGDGVGDVANALSALRPSAASLDRDRLMFLAGRATAEREMAPQIAAGPSVAAAAITGAGLAGQFLPGRGGMLSPWLWPSATAAATVAASVLGLLLAMSHRPLVIREKVYVQAEPTTQALPTTQTPAAVSRNSGQPDILVAPPAGIADGPLTAEVVSREAVRFVQIDVSPRTSLPPSNYVRSRELALSLGVEALGSWTPSGGDEHPVAYRERLDDVVSDVESR